MKNCRIAHLLAYYIGETAQITDKALTVEGKVGGQRRFG